MNYLSGMLQNSMEGKGNIVTMREVTKEGDSPVEQGGTKGGTREGKSIQERQVGIGWSPHKEQRRSMGVILQR